MPEDIFHIEEQFRELARGWISEVIVPQLHNLASSIGRPLEREEWDALIDGALEAAVYENQHVELARVFFRAFPEEWQRWMERAMDEEN